MKVVMINDCAFVAETLVKYFPLNIEQQQIKRARDWWSKTLGIAYDILKAKANVYHAHYLLQDCYIASRLGKKPLIGHAHGSDLTSSLKHALWSRVVRHNLKHCDRILVSTPNLVTLARQFRSDAEYIPNPVDLSLFYPKPVMNHNGKTRVLIASSSNWKAKGTDIAVKGLSEMKDEVDVSIIGYGKDLERTLNLASSLGLDINVLQKLSHCKLGVYYWDSDVVIDQFTVGALGMTSLESIACGRPVVTYVSSEYAEHKDFPLRDVKDAGEVKRAIKTASPELWEKQYQYLLNNHHPEKIARKILSVYSNLWQ